MTRARPAVPPKFMVEPFDHSIQNQADPQIDQQAYIQPIGDVLSQRRQVWHQKKKVEEVANHDSNKLLE